MPLYLKAATFLQNETTYLLHVPLMHEPLQKDSEKSWYYGIGSSCSIHELDRQFRLVVFFSAGST